MYIPLRLTLLTFLGIVLIASTTWAQTTDASTPKWIRATYRDDPATTISIGWTGSKSTLYYGTDKKKLDQFTSQKPDVTTHYIGATHYFVRLKNLTPNTLYYVYWKGKDGKKVTATHTFRTLSDDPNEPISFVSGGDSRQAIPVKSDALGCWGSGCRETRQNINTLVGRIRPDFVAFTGDYIRGFNAEFTAIKRHSTVENGDRGVLLSEYDEVKVVKVDTTEDWTHWLDDWSLTIQNGRIIPVIHTLGNHERSRDLINLFDVKDRMYHATDFGGGLLRFYTLDSEPYDHSKAGNEYKKTRAGEPCKGSACDDNGCIEQVQIDWFKKDLEASKAQKIYWKIVQYHRPMIPQAHYCPRKDLIRAWTPLFREHGVRLVCESHAHIMKATYPLVYDANNPDNLLQRNDQEGAVFIGDGSWGAPLRKTFKLIKGTDGQPLTREAESIAGFFFINVNQQRIAVTAVVPYHDGMYDLPDAPSKNEDRQGRLIPVTAPLWRTANGAMYFTIPPFKQ